MIKIMRGTRLKLLLAANYLNTFGWALYSPLYALFVLHVGGTQAQVSFIWAGYAFLTGILIVAFGRLENKSRFNPNIMLVIGYLLFTVVALSFLIVDNVYQFVVAQVTLSVAMGVMTPASKATYMKAEEKGKEAGEWGLFDGGNYLIGAGAAFLGGLLLKFGSFRLIFVVMAFIQLLAALYAYNHWRLARRGAHSSKKLVYATEPINS